MSNRYISAPLEDLLLKSGFSALKVDAALERLARQRRPTVLGPGHFYPRQIRLQTGVRVVMIVRRYRRLLVQIEQIANNRVAWQYFERGRNNCVFSSRGPIPHTIASALVGRPLSTLALPTPALGSTNILNIEHPDG